MTSLRLVLEFLLPMTEAGREFWFVFKRLVEILRSIIEECDILLAQISTNKMRINTLHDLRSPEVTEKKD